MSTKELLFLVDDEPDLIMAYAPLFENKYEVAIFDSAKAALDAVDKGQVPSVIVTDLNMPMMDGLQLCNELRQKGVFSPVLLMSGYLDKDLSIRATNSGVYALIEKPFRVHEFEATLNAAAEDFQRHVRVQKFHQAANSFVMISQSILVSYRHRYEESERLLKGLGLLPHNPGEDMKSIFGTDDLESKMKDLMGQLKELEDLDQSQRPIKKAA
jgi:FixJ family two-component response regulator